MTSQVLQCFLILLAAFRIIEAFTPSPNTALHQTSLLNRAAVPFVRGKTSLCASSDDSETEASKSGTIIAVADAQDEQTAEPETVQQVTEVTEVALGGAALDGIDLADATVNTEELFMEGATFAQLTIPDHRPLGCTVEESLASDEVPHVFVSKVVPGGFADMAGLQVGDVVVGVTGMFGKMTQVAGLGVDKVKSFVGAVPDEDPLTMIIARDTDVMAKHEEALVDLCSTPGSSDKDIEKSVVDYISGGFDYSSILDDDDDDDDDTDDNDADDDASEVDCMDSDAECMIADMNNLWAEELPPPPPIAGITQSSNGRKSAAPVKPWSVRSSPSGTWVRDPKTGEMRNIDA